MLANAKTTNVQDRRSSIKACPPLSLCKARFLPDYHTVAIGPKRPFAALCIAATGLVEADFRSTGERSAEL